MFVSNTLQRYVSLRKILISALEKIEIFFTPLLIVVLLSKTVLWEQMGSKWLSTSLSTIKFWGSKRSCCQQEKTFEFHSVLRKNRGKKERNLLTFNPQMKCWMSVNKLAHFFKRSKPFQVLAVRVEYLSQHCKRCWWWSRQLRCRFLSFVCSQITKAMLHHLFKTNETEKDIL